MDAALALRDTASAIPVGRNVSAFECLLLFVDLAPISLILTHFFLFLSVWIDCVAQGGSIAEWMLDSGAEGPGFKSQPRRCLATVLGKLFTPIVPLFTKQKNW